MADSNENKKGRFLYDTGSGITIFGIHIPYWLIILLLVLFIVYMWIEDKSPTEVFSLQGDDFRFSTFDSSPVRPLEFPYQFKF